MQIEKNKFVTFHYSVKDDEGNAIDSSIGKEPLCYVHGQKMLISGLENALSGKEKGEKFQVRLLPSEAYGFYNPRLIMVIPPDQFDDPDKIEVGQVFETELHRNQTGYFHVIGFDDEGNVKVDGNHELAGKTLDFDVEIVDVRDATSDEIQDACNEWDTCESCEGCSGCMEK